MLVLKEAQAPPEGAMCAVHPDWPAQLRCAKCGVLCCQGCWVEVGTDLYYCSQCEPPPRTATRPERFRAYTLDMMLIALPAIPSAAASALGDDGATTVPMLAYAATAVMLALVVGGNLWLVHKRSQSIGKWAFSLQVVQLDGSPASLARIVLVRNLPILMGTAVGNLVGLGWILMLADPIVIFGPDQRCLHDYIAGTRVVRLPDPRP